MQKVWSSDPDIQNVGPTNKSVNVRWDMIGKGLARLFDGFPELKALMEPQIKIVGAVAWAMGVEQIQRKNEAGARSSNGNLVTTSFKSRIGVGSWCIAMPSE